MNHTISLPLLDRIHVASPCGARWEDMVGDDQTRHCGRCNLSVHNLTAMNRDEAEAVLSKLAEGRVCARFWRRADSTVITQDCLVGVAAARARARRVLRRVAAMVGLVTAAGFTAASTCNTTWGQRIRLRALKPYSIVCEWISPAVTPATRSGITDYDGGISLGRFPLVPPAASPILGEKK